MSALSFPSDELSDLELLASALREAVEARATGALGGADVDEVGLRRAERRARQADARRLHEAVAGDAA